MIVPPRLSLIMLWLLLAPLAEEPCLADAREAPADRNVEITLRFSADPMDHEEDGPPKVQVQLRLWNERSDKAEEANSSPAIREYSVPVPGEVQVQVPAGSRWWLAVESDEYWLAERLLDVGVAGGGVFSFVLRPAGWVTARVTSSQDRELPSAIQLGVMQSRVRETAARARSSCPVTEGSIRCKVPAGLIDAKLSSEGKTPHYFWDLEVAPEETISLGELILVQGASLTGWVLGRETSKETSENPARIQASLAPEVYGYGTDPTDEARLGSMDLRTPVQDNGFFQLTGIPQGTFRLRVTSPNHSTYESEPLTIDSAEELELDPIELLPRATVRVFVEPATDPFHVPWRFELQQREAHSVIVGRYDGEANPEGLWEVPAAELGSYSLTIYDSRGSKWHMERLGIWQEDLEQRVELPLTRLEIRLSLAGQPLEKAQIELKNLMAGAKLRRMTNDEGVAYFFLPTDLEWEAMVIQPDNGVRAEFHDLAVPEVEWDERWPVLELEVPDTTIRGVVVNEDGQLQPEAFVDLEVAGGDGLDTPVDSDGTFELRGFQPGLVTLQARKREGNGEHRRSQAVTLHALEKQETGPVRLILQESQILEGQVVAPSGAPVPGAFVVAFPEFPSGPPNSMIEQVYTDADGVFQVSVRTSVSSVQLAVFPPGFSATQQRIPLPAEPVIVPVDTAGGTIVLEWDRSSEAVDDLDLMQQLRTRTTLLRDSLVGAGQFLIHWYQLNGVPYVPGTLELPMMEPGHYTACFGDRAVQETIAGRPVPWEVQDLCVSGYLGDGDELLLTLPTSP